MTDEREAYQRALEEGMISQEQIEKLFEAYLAGHHTFHQLDMERILLWAVETIENSLLLVGVLEGRLLIGVEKGKVIFGDPNDVSQ